MMIMNWRPIWGIVFPPDGRTRADLLFDTEIEATEKLERLRAVVFKMDFWEGFWESAYVQELMLGRKEDSPTVAAAGENEQTPNTKGIPHT